MRARLATPYSCLQLLAHALAQLFQIVDAQALGQLVVDGRGNELLQLLHVDVEDGILAGQLLARIVGREGHLDLALVAGLAPIS